MQHVVIHEHGHALGITSERLVIREAELPERHIPLRKISTISIQKQGVRATRVAVGHSRKRLA